MGEESLVSVCVDSPLPHLDRLFNYAVPPALASIVDVGTRVRVPFHGRLVGGIVCARGSDSDYSGRIRPIHSAGLVPSTTQAGIELARLVAHRYGGSLWDVLRLAVPPRVASVERRWAGRGVGPAPGTIKRIEAASSSLSFDPALVSGNRVVWEAMPDLERSSLPASTLAALAFEGAQGSSVILVVPDSRAIGILERRLQENGLTRWTSRSGGDFAVIHTEDGPTVRFENYLAAMHGAAPIVIGTRSTVFQPVPTLAFLLLWGEGHSAYQDLHAPYPHARTVAAIRSEAEDSRLILGAWAPSIEAVALAGHGWARFASASREEIRHAVPAVEVLTGERRGKEGPRGWHWMPGVAWRELMAGLPNGPVFVLVPRAGYVNALSCAHCGQWARCLTCEGALRRASKDAPLTCMDCGAENPQWHCPDCHTRELSESRQGVERIAEQVRRMAPSVSVVVSSTATGIIDDGVVTAGIVVATPGALPAVSEGYATGVIISADSGLGLVGTEVDAAGLWFSAAALIKPKVAGGRLVIVGEVEPSVRRALETWTPGDLARDVAKERAELGLPPFRRIVRIEGSEVQLTRAKSLPLADGKIGSHAEIAEIPSPPGSLVLLCGRRIAQEVIDSLRDLERELSSAGTDGIRMRVDGPMVLPG